MGKKRTGTKEWADVSKNTHLGCIRNCQYCYARDRANDYGYKKLDDWENMERNKYSLKDMKHNRFKKISEDNEYFDIMFPTTHDIFPEHLDEIIEYIKGWLEKGNTMLIVSKPIYECIVKLTTDLWDYKDQIEFRFTICSTDNDVLEFWESKVEDYEDSIYDDRKNCVRLAIDMDYDVSISLEPILDKTAETVIEDVKGLGVKCIWLGKMNLAGKRVKVEDWEAEDFDYWDLMEEANELEYLEKLYEKYKDDDKVIFKCTFREAVDIDEKEEMDK